MEHATTVRRHLYYNAIQEWQRSQTRDRPLQTEELEQKLVERGLTPNLIRSVIENARTRSQMLRVPPENCLRALVALNYADLLIIQQLEERLRSKQERDASIIRHLEEQLRGAVI